MRRPVLPSHFIHVVSGAMRGGSLVILELEDDEAAVRLGGKLPNETGRTVIVKDAAMVEIQTFPAAIKQ